MSGDDDAPGDGAASPDRTDDPGGPARGVSARRYLPPQGRADPAGPPTRQVPLSELFGDEPARAGAGGARRQPPAQAPAPAQGPAPARMPLRHRVLPRTLLGLTAFILSFAIGAGLSGVVLFSYYQYRLDQSNQRVNTLVNGYKQQFANAEAALRSETDTDRTQISSALAPLEAEQATPTTLAALTRQLAPSVFFVHTLDSAGQASVGSAFVISSSSTQSLLLTSYTAVEAATSTPGPAVYVQQGPTSTPVSVYDWDPTYDLALIILPRGGLPVVPVAPTSPAPTVGERVYAVSGQASSGAALSQGLVVDVSADGIQHDAALGPAFQGGPLVNGSGQVIATGSRAYAPLGFASDGVWYSPYVQAACNRVLSCPNGELPGAGTGRVGGG